jgi:nucleoside-diphosphate-sugar epimerase
VRILITGATGFLGSHLTVALAHRGETPVLLARGKDGVPALRRMEALFRWFDLDASTISRCEVTEEFPAGIDEVVHCASSTSFSARYRNQSESANVEALGRILELSRGCRHFHYVSTAYVAGATTGLCPEMPCDPPGYNNVYEETKNRAERLLVASCPVPFSIIRPSIVYGDSRTGRTFRWNGLYLPVRAVVFLRDSFLRDIQESDGARAAACGVKLSDGGIGLPIHVPAGGVGIDLIPVDAFVRACLALFDRRPPGPIHHVVSGSPVRIETLIEYCERFFGIHGLEPVQERDAPASRNPLQILFDRMIGPYRPYMCDGRRFLAGDASRWADVPPFDYGAFSRAMTYAVETGWGERGGPTCVA